MGQLNLYSLKKSAKRWQIPDKTKEPGETEEAMCIEDRIGSKYKLFNQNMIEWTPRQLNPLHN
jgi:hypothetical protein